MGDTSQEKIRDALARKTKILTERPQTAPYTTATTVRLADGMVCEVEQKGWRMVADQPQGMGGDNLGPDPSFFGKAALGVCIAQGYALHFALNDIPL